MLKARKTKSRTFLCVFECTRTCITCRIKNPKKEAYWCIHVALKRVDGEDGFGGRSQVTERLQGNADSGW